MPIHSFGRRVSASGNIEHQVSLQFFKKGELYRLSVFSLVDGSGSRRQNGQQKRRNEELKMLREGWRRSPEIFPFNLHLHDLK
jgi:hypothetical protein